MTPDARSSNGTPLFNNACPDCGAIRLSDKRRLGKPCHPCAQKRRATHGLTDHPLYRKLKNIEVRCRYPSATNYAYYGGRGIKVCEEWSNDPASFVAWAQANGYAPGLEIDRIDVDGDYSPQNCRLVSHKENSQKRRSSRCTQEAADEVRRMLSEGSTISTAAAAAGVPYMSAWHISKGNTWRVEC